MKETGRPLAKLLREAMAELESAMKAERPLDELFTIRTVEVAEPTAYSARDIRIVRTRLRVSQAVFAKLMGVSVQLVEHWEQGICRPRSMACRLIDEVRRNPDDFLLRHMTAAQAVFRKTG